MLEINIKFYTKITYILWVFRIQPKMNFNPQDLSSLWCKVLRKWFTIKLFLNKNKIVLFNLYVLLLQIYSLLWVYSCIDFCLAVKSTPCAFTESFLKLNLGRSAVLWAMPEGKDDSDAICSSFLPPHIAEVTFYKFIRIYFAHMFSKLKFKQITPK